jgi:hypothetical protein
VPWKYIPPPTIPTPLGGGVTLVTGLVPQGGRVVVPCTSLRGDAYGTSVLVDVNSNVRIKVTCLPIPKGVPATAYIMINGKYVKIGTARVNGNGVLVLPPMKIKQPGVYRVKVVGANGRMSFFDIRVK